MIRQSSAKLEQRMLEENNNDEPNNSENAEDQIQIQEGGQDPGQRKTKDNIARNQTKPEINLIGMNKKRRDLKIEREELTNLLVQLIMYVNQRATGSEDCEDKMRSLGAGVNGVKNRVRPFRGKKEEDGKIGGGGPEEVFLRKGSIKDDKGCGERLEQQKWKRELFANYQGLMSYKIHSQQQRVQFTFNPLQAHPLSLPAQSPVPQPTKTQQLLTNGPRNDQQSESKGKPSAQTLARKNSKDSRGPGLELGRGVNERHFSVYRSVSIMIAPGGSEGL